MAVLIILAVWLLVSVPAALAAGWLLRAGARPELVGMDGIDAVFVEPDGTLRREPLVDTVRS